MNKELKEIKRRKWEGKAIRKHKKSLPNNIKVRTVSAHYFVCLTGGTHLSERLCLFPSISTSYDAATRILDEQPNMRQGAQELHQKQSIHSDNVNG
jgi:hypothetical protein